MAGIPTVSAYAGTESITTAEAKAYLRIDHTFDDDYIDELIKIARLQVLKDTNQSLVEINVTEFRDKWPNDNIIHLAYPSRVTDVVIFYQKKKDLENPLVQGEDYIIRSVPNNNDGRIELLKTYNLATDINGIRITYKSNTINTDDTRPLKIAMYMLIQHFYDNRSPVSYLKVDEMPLAYKHIIAQYKRYSFS
jgi:uncharacterized phiE125 gp8 family phage protein|tara:strand:+ start:247 stop:825 length:579 start_codon:yes stop_codon:yes gene_type:complete